MKPGRVASGELVFAEHLEELDVAELTGGGLGQAGVDGLEHAAELEGTQCRLRADGSWSSDGLVPSEMGEEAFGAVEVGRHVGHDHQLGSLVLGAGDQDPLDGPIGRVADLRGPGGTPRWCARRRTCRPGGPRLGRCAGDRGR